MLGKLGAAMIAIFKAYDPEIKTYLQKKCLYFCHKPMTFIIQPNQYNNFPRQEMKIACFVAQCQLRANSVMFVLYDSFTLHGKYWTLYIKIKKQFCIHLCLKHKNHPPSIFHSQIFQVGPLYVLLNSKGIMLFNG